MCAALPFAQAANVGAFQSASPADDMSHHAHVQSARFIVSWQQPQTTAKAAKSQLSAIRAELGVNARWVKNTSGNASIVEFDYPFAQSQPLKQPQPQPLIQYSEIHWHKHVQRTLEALPNISAVSADAPVHTFAQVDDPFFSEQWQLQDSAAYPAALDIERAWDLTQGLSSTVVAIIDTGIHYANPDLAGRLLPGYDFVSPLSLSVPNGVSVPEALEFERSNDGDGRDADAEDPGDAVNDETLALFDSLRIECSTSNSTWHGTAMASIIAANANDAHGMAGIDWHAQILPVRAIGRCGGRRSDLLDAIRWAAGVNDPTLPPNPHPARIINLSLGVEDLCTAADQRAIDDAIDAGAIVIAAVGNSGRNTNSNPSSPSHCQNVLGVMAIDHNGFKAGYSNFGRDADIAAPGGSQSPSPYNIMVSTNKGKDRPSSMFDYRRATGTSVATPHVAGVLALMLSVRPDLSNKELEALLLESTRSFPTDTTHFNCTAELCGAGILDAYQAVYATTVYEPGSLNDSPTLGAAQSVPVSVGRISVWLMLLLFLGTIRQIALANGPSNKVKTNRLISNP